MNHNQLLADAKAIIENAKAEQRDLSKDEAEKVEHLYAEFDKANEQQRSKELTEKVERAEAELRQPRRQIGFNNNIEAANKDRNDEAFRSWAMGDRSQPDVRALSKGTNSAGGFTVPQSFSSQLDKALSYYFTVTDAISTFSTEDGRDYPWPTVDDTANASSIVTEASGIGSSSDPTFGQVVFKSWDYYSPIVKVSNQVIRDSVVDFPSMLADLFAERMGRALDAAVVGSNAGSSAPEGMLNGVSVGVNLATGNPITQAKLIALETSVPLAYRNLPGVGFIMHDATWQAIRQLEDLQGRLLVNSDIQSGVVKRLLGYPVFISNGLTSISSPGDNQPLILFGALKKYQLRRVGGSTLTRMNELYAANGQVGFVLHEAFDGRWLTKAGVKTLNSFDAP
jgi:HK97 family phage major capsid protein